MASAPGSGNSTLEKRKVQEKGLSSFDLWGTLPEVLIENILSKVPFSSVLRLCCVCKMWRDDILSGHVFFFFHTGRLMVRRSDRGIWGMWESVPLHLYLEDVEQLNSLYLVASAGGMLCFSTDECGEYRICNPFTRRHKKLKLPTGEIPPHNMDEPWMPLPEDQWRERPWRRMFTLVAMFMISNTEHFQLIVTSLDIFTVGRTLIYDSRADSWKPAARLDQGSLFLVKPVVCRGNAYSLVYCHGSGDKLVKYNVVQDKWSWMLKPEELGVAQNLIECNGKVFYVTETQHLLQYFEVQESGHGSLALALSPDPQPVPAVYCDLIDRIPKSLSTNERYLEYFGQGDVMCFLACMGKSISGASGLIVWIHNFLTDSNLVSHWEEWPLDAFPSYGDSVICMPSMLPLH